MNVSALKDQAALGEQRITELERHIEQQRQIVAQLEDSWCSQSESIAIARELLRNMEQNLTRQIAHRERLRALQQQPQPDDLDDE